MDHLTEQHRVATQRACDGVRDEMNGVMETKLGAARAQHQSEMTSLRHDLQTQHTLTLASVELKATSLQKHMDERDATITTLTTQLATTRGRVADMEMDGERKTLEWAESKLQLKTEAEVRTSAGCHHDMCCSTIT